MRKLIFQNLTPLVFAAMLIAVSACAQSPTTPATSSSATDTKAIFQPYLGKWRPTSFSEQQNIGSLTISIDKLSYEVGGESVSYEVVRQIDEGVILRVKDRKPANHPRAARAVVFSLEKKTVKGVAPTDVTTTREFLWIYWCSSVDSLASGLTKASCSGNAYTR